jgi:hypothetical protein
MQFVCYLNLFQLIFVYPFRGSQAAHNTKLNFHFMILSTPPDHRQLPASALAIARSAPIAAGRFKPASAAKDGVRIPNNIVRLME